MAIDPCPRCGLPAPPRSSARGPAPKVHPACGRLHSALGWLEREMALLPDMQPQVWADLRARLLRLANRRRPPGSRRDPGTGQWVAGP